ncbi:MAG TPA: glycerol-3-phosphate 1-O-acyltransferase PlsY [Xanthobacteraceae bacterium]|nr:glycerol-3-phosphate 1-O-acyltransferase PlsY [Xanthobacteraceae bacterium]
MSHPVGYAGACIFGYLLGSIPFGLVLTRLAGTQDLRTIGSGNIGATNVWRTGRKGLAVATAVLDALKGTVAVLIVAHVGGRDLALPAALGAFLGHLFPVWLEFHGGKAVATFIGLLLAFVCQAALVFCLVWLTVALLTRYSSLAGLVASLVTTAFLWFGKYLPEAELFTLLTVLMWAKHHANIKRLITGTESKIGF